MANCSNLFKEYNNTIRLSDSNRELLLRTRETLRNRMKSVYGKFDKSETGNTILEFQTQGSIVMDTIITPEKEDFDLDDGVYFGGKLSVHQRPKPQVFHNWVVRAIDRDVEYEEITDKDTCVRIKYKKGFHIDLPIYYASEINSPDLAHKKKGWILSNPVEFIAWFEEIAQSGFQKAFLYESLAYSLQFDKWLTDQRKKDTQIRRIVRYLKAWADLKRGEMPSGIEMTILIGYNISLNEREDIALRDTLRNIKMYLLSNNSKCPRPTTPEGEDLFASKTQEEKDYFMKNINTLLDSANKAIDANNQKEACKEWEKHFGKRFPCQLASDKIEYAAKNISALYGIASQSKPYGDTSKNL